jgi:hypothetical protein
LQGVDVDEFLFALAPAFEDRDGMVDVDVLEPQRDWNVVPVGGLDEHGGLEPPHPIWKLDVGLANGRRRLWGGGRDAPLDIVLVRLNGLPVNH